MNEKFAEAVKRITRVKVAATTGKVTKVTGTTCVVEREGNLPPLHDVRLHAVEGDFDDVVLIVPAIGSEVLCLVVDGAEPETAIVKTTQVDRVLISIGGAELEIVDGKFKVKNEHSDLKEILEEIVNVSGIMSGHIAQLATALGMAQIAQAQTQHQIEDWGLSMPDLINNLLNE